MRLKIFLYFVQWEYFWGNKKIMNEYNNYDIYNSL